MRRKKTEFNRSIQRQRGGQGWPRGGGGWQPNNRKKGRATGFKPEPARPINRELVRAAEIVAKSIRETDYINPRKDQVFNIPKGIFLVDCSALIEHLLNMVYQPETIRHIKGKYVGKTNTEQRFFAKDFYKLGKLGEFRYGRRIDSPREAEAGDIFVIKYPPTAKHTGHVMALLSKPKIVSTKLRVKSLISDIGNKINESAKNIDTYSVSVIHSSGLNKSGGVGVMQIELRWHREKKYIKSIQYEGRSAKTAYSNLFIRFLK